MLPLLAALTLTLHPGPAQARQEMTLGMFSGFNPNLQVFGPGPFVNVFLNDQAATNASAHLAWSTAIPLAGERIGGRKGLWIAGIGWLVLTLVGEGFFHAPVHPDPYYSSEVRTDLLTRCVPTVAILSYDLWTQP